MGFWSRSKSVAEDAQAALEQPKLTDEDAQAAKEPTLDHSGSILERFEGVQSAPRIGRGESRSTFAKIDFFRLGDPLSRDFGSPETPRSASGLPLGALWGALDPLGPCLGLPKGAQREPLSLIHI